MGGHIVSCPSSPQASVSPFVVGLLLKYAEQAFTSSSRSWNAAVDQAMTTEAWPQDVFEKSPVNQGLGLP